MRRIALRTGHRGVKTARGVERGNRRWMDYCVVQDLPTLVWAANLADLELHTSLSLGQDKNTVPHYDGFRPGSGRAG